MQNFFRKYSGWEKYAESKYASTYYYKLTSTGNISRKLVRYFHNSTNFWPNNWIFRNSRVVLKQSFQTAKQVPAQTLFQAKNTWRVRFQLHHTFVVFLTPVPAYSVLTRRRIDKRWFWCRKKKVEHQVHRFLRPGMCCHEIKKKRITKEIPPPQYMMHCPQFAFIRSRNY